MPQIRVLGKGAQITGGIFVLLLAAHTWSWIVYDLAHHGLADTWGVWTNSLAPDRLPATVPVTSATDLGLGVLQAATAFAALSRVRACGGMLAATTALTFGYRLPVLWQTVMTSPDDSFYGPPKLEYGGDDLELGLSFGTCLLALLLCFVLAIVLMAGNSTWPRPAAPGPGLVPGQAPQPLPEDPPQRPTPAGAAVAGIFLALLAVLDLAWMLYVVVQGGGPGALFSSGRGSLVSVLSVPAYWSWLLEFLLCGIGALLAFSKRLSARGYALAFALLTLPTLITGLSGFLSTGALFDFSGPAPGVAVLAHIRLLATLAGALAVLVLTVRPGVPAEPGAPGPPLFGQPPFGQPPMGQAPFGQPPYGQPAGAPGVPPQQPYGSPAGAPAPGVPGYGYPQPPAQPPQGPPPPQQPPSGGGFGPPPGA
ncbi:hypothetical protein [Streptomyces sp. ODS28]|uniref:hypothetical protein n=1 Tax=Streptomyces sp. ODS28 TaxID=3136688 RepID=UPI0031F17E49